jgi:hypothetical protein
MTARALCYGIRPDAAASVELSRLGEPGFIHGIPLLLKSGRVINTAIIDAMVDRGDAVALTFEAGGFFLIDGISRFECEPVPQPVLLSEASGFEGPWSSYARMHSPRTLFLTPLRQCIFAKIGKVCQFCTYEGGGLSPLPVAGLADLVSRVASDIGPLDVAIGSGTPNLDDHGVRYFAHLANAIRDRTASAISVELVPPPNLDDLDILRKSSVESRIMSIEIWNDEKRGLVCPGKSYMDKAHYVRAWENAVSLFGPGKVSSVLLVGLDTVSNIREAIDYLISMKVIPTLIPFRPYNNTALSGHPLTSVEDFVDCASYNALALSAARLNPFSQRGCTACQGCSMDTPEQWAAP